MRGGTFNLRFGRDPDVVRREVTDLLEQENLDFLGMQETEDYIKALRDIPGYKLVTGKGSIAGAQFEVAALVKKEHTVTAVQTRAFGNGWALVGGRMKPRAFLKFTINRKHKVAVLHLPSKVNLVTGQPEEKYDDYVAQSKRAVRFFRFPNLKSRTLVMDGNQPAKNPVKYSPRWVAKKTNATLHSPDNGIDYMIVKGLELWYIKKLRNFGEKSDHDPVVWNSYREGT